MASTVDRGRSLQVFAKAQTSFTAPSGAGIDYPVAADALRVVTASSSGTSPIEAREDKYGSSTRVLGAAQKMTAEASLDCYLMGGGTQTAEPPAGPLLEASGWTEIDLTGQATTTSGTASTSTVIRVTNGAGAAFTVGGALKVEQHDGAAGVGTYQVRKITANDASGDPDLITITPPLDFTPNLAGLNVKGCRAYKPKDSRDAAEDSVALFIGNDLSCDQVLGWVPGSTSLTLGSDTAARLSTSGTARQRNRMVETTINDSGGISSSITTMVVSDAYASGGTDRGLNTYWKIESEVVKLTAVSGTTWTIVRGTALGGSAAGHSDGLAIYPYPLTISGTISETDPIAATSGGAWLSAVGGSAVTSLQVSSCNIEAGSSVAYREDAHGDEYKVRGYTSSPREVSITMTGWTHLATLQQSNILASADTDVVTICCQQGASEGSIFAAICPQVRLDPPSLDRGAEEVAYEVTGGAFGSVTGADEILLCFG